MGRLIGAVYIVITLVIAIYENYWGVDSFRSFWFNLGKAWVWPIAMWL